MHNLEFYNYERTEPIFNLDTTNKNVYKQYE